MKRHDGDEIKYVCLAVFHDASMNRLASPRAPTNVHPRYPREGEFPLSRTRLAQPRCGIERHEAGHTTDRHDSAVMS